MRKRSSLWKMQSKYVPTGCPTWIDTKVNFYFGYVFRGLETCPSRFLTQTFVHFDKKIKYKRFTLVSIHVGHPVPTYLLYAF